MVGPHFSSGRAMLATLDYINRLFLSQGNTINYRTEPWRCDRSIAGGRTEA